MFNCLALCQGLSTDVHYVDEDTADLSTTGTTNSSSLESFRKMVKEACVETYDADNDNGKNCKVDNHQDMSVDRVLIVSYTRKTLKQTGSGHFSPIAAYDQESDSVLIMDTVSHQRSDSLLAIVGMKMQSFASHDSTHKYPNKLVSPFLIT